MHSKLFTVAGLASLALAQDTANMTLTNVLNSTSSLSNLTSYVALFPSLMAQLSSATNITILAPSNDAFAKLLNTSAGMSLATDMGMVEALLSYHVLNGTYYASDISSTAAFVNTALTNTSYTNVTGGQVVEAITEGNNVTFFSGLLQNATVSQADLNFTGGVIHVIDEVLTLPVNISTTATSANLTAAYGALNASGLLDTVDTMSDVTVFVPNNAAFQAIGSAVANLSMTELATILEYHVVNGTVGYSTMLSNMTLNTAQGGSVTITVINGTVYVNSAKVVLPDVLVANGVVHVIDNVLNPSNTTATPNPTASTEAPSFPSATSASDIPFTSGAATPTTTVATSNAGAGATSSSSTGGAAAMPMKTGAVAAAALFGAGVAWGL